MTQANGTVNWASSTWPNPPAGDVTQWVYDQPSGLLAEKIYADSHFVSYGYNSGNFLDVKTNGRSQTISYNVDTAGLVRNVAYSDNTPSVTMDYDRADRLRTVTDAAGTRSVTWTDRDQMQNETYTAGLLSGMSVNRTYDSQFRLGVLQMQQSGVTQTREQFEYDSISWLDYIADETPDGSTVLHNYDYAFMTNTPFVQSVAFYQGTTNMMTQTYAHDGLGRLTGAGATEAGSQTVSGVNYQLDNLNRRSEADLADSTKWNYGYDNRSEVTSGKRKLASGAMAGGEQFEYNYDDIGNRTSTEAGGDAAGNNLRAANYSANALNQYVTRDVPGSIWMVGDAATNLTLQGIVSGSQFSLQRQDGQRFFGEGTVTNSTNAVYARMLVAGKTNGVLNDVVIGYRYVAQTPESFGYDGDGNETNDGRWTITWDAENRATSFTSLSNAPAASKKLVTCAYDYQGRRIQKIVSTWNGTAYVAQSTNRFVYDGWNLIGILDGNNNLLTSFEWGQDLSGTLQGAGGVGGLLSMTVYSGTNAGVYFYSFDGNGNVVALVNAADGTVPANYEYDPFGQVTRTTGVMAKPNPFRFSTKYQDDETGLDYYGYRFFNPNEGKWLSRDPIEENGGANLFGFLDNSSLNYVDNLGLAGTWTAPSLENAPPPVATPPPPGYVPPQPIGLLPNRPAGDMGLVDWTFTRHSINFKMSQKCCKKCSEIADKIYKSLKAFSDWNPNSYANAVPVKLLPSGAPGVTFDTPGVPGIAMGFANMSFGGSSLDINPVYVSLSFNDVNRVVTARTLGDHMLVGVRKWSVSYAADGKNCSFALHTWAVDKTRNMRNYLGGFTPPGREAQREIWVEYLNNIVAPYRKSSCFISGDPTATPDDPVKMNFNPFIR